jgi:hypothetical protein
LELEQRLDEPTETTRAIESVLSNQKDETPMHLFDIRRSRSVIELWKDVEQNSAQRRYTPESISQLRLTSLSDSFIPSKYGHSPEIRELEINQSTNLHKQWLDACRPPQLLPKVESESGLQDPVICDVNVASEASASEKTSSTIMSSSAITSEGRRQVSSKCL